MENELNEETVDAGEILLELSLSNLRNNVERDGVLTPDKSNTRTHRASKIQIVNYEFIPSVPDRTLLLKARVSSPSGGKYQSSIRFVNVQFANEEQPGYVEVDAIDGRTYYIKQLTHTQTTVRVRCTCLDFYWRMATWDHARKSLEGDPPPPYVKKTDRPPVNPNHVPGICKHLNKLGQFLRAERIIR